MDDRTATAEVKHALDISPAGDFTEVAVAVRDGLADLSGVFRSSSERLAAREIVAGTTGVRSLRDRSSVRDSDCLDSPPPAAERAIRSALRAVDATGVDVTVIGTRAVMTGRVRDQSERHLAQRAVRSVPGIHFVDDLTSFPDESDGGDHA